MTYLITDLIISYIKTQQERLHLQSPLQWTSTKLILTRNFWSKNEPLDLEISRNAAYQLKKTAIPFRDWDVIEPLQCYSLSSQQDESYEMATPESQRPLPLWNTAPDKKRIHRKGAIGQTKSGTKWVIKIG